jgi:hypothetical protein
VSAGPVQVLAGLRSVLLGPFGLAVGLVVVNGLVGLVLVTRAPTFARRLSDRVAGDFATTFLFGLLVVPGAGFALVVRGVALSALPAAPAGAAYLVGLVAGSALGTLALGRWLVARLGGTGGLRAGLLAAVVVSAVLGVVPVAGPTVAGACCVAGTGALTEWVLDGSDAPDRTIPGVGSSDEAWLRRRS